MRQIFVASNEFQTMENKITCVIVLRRASIRRCKILCDRKFFSCRLILKYKQSSRTNIILDVIANAHISRKRNRFFCSEKDRAKTVFRRRVFLASSLLHSDAPKSRRPKRVFKT